MISIILTGAALIREREHGTIEHLLVMPVTPMEIMVSKVLAMGLVVLVSAAASMIFVVQWLMHVPVGGSVTLFLIGAGLTLFPQPPLAFIWRPWRAACPNSAC